MKYHRSESPHLNGSSCVRFGPDLGTFAYHVAETYSYGGAGVGDVMGLRETRWAVILNSLRDQCGVKAHEQAGLSKLLNMAEWTLTKSRRSDTGFSDTGHEQGFVTGLRLGTCAPTQWRQDLR